MKKEIRLDDLLGYLEDLVSQVEEEFDAAMKQELSTVEELDEQTDIPDLEGEDTNYDVPKTPVIPKWKAVELQVLDVIGNTLKQKDPIALETATTLKILAEVRDLILSRHPIGIKRGAMTSADIKRANPDAFVFNGSPSDFLVRA